MGSNQKLWGTINVRFSNRPVWVKRFQTIPTAAGRCRSRARASLRGSAPGPFHHGFKNRVDQSIGRPCRRTHGRSSGHCDLTSSSVPRGHHATAWWSSRFSYRVWLYTALTLQRRFCSSEFGAINPMRCTMTAKRRASATIAFFMPRRLAICIAQALTQDHFAQRASIIWAAS